MMRVWLAAVLAAAAGVAFGMSALGQTQGTPPTAPGRQREDPDWPCQQRLMPTLGGAALWSGPPIEEAAAWRSEPDIAALVEKIAPRSVSADVGVAEIDGFFQQIAAGQDRQRKLALAFAGLLEETNSERSAVIARLKELGHRQHELAEIASQAGDELREIPPDATGDAAARRADLEQRFAFVTQAFQSAQRTMRYACEVPVRLEARLGRYAKALQDRL
jgi:hypothetical protein